MKKIVFTFVAGAILCASASPSLADDRRVYTQAKKSAKTYAKIYALKSKQLLKEKRRQKLGLSRR